MTSRVDDQYTPAMRFLIQSLCLLGFLIGLSACTSTDKVDTSTAEGAYELAQKYVKNERYEEAVTYFREVKNKHPYSRFATESELAIADIEFKRENFGEAEAAYRLFKELHPSHEKMDYVTFRLGLSIYKQIPATTDRDLTEANRCILYFDEILTSFPKSPYAKEAGEKKLSAKKMLADKAIYIADFYFKTKKWQSAMGRYEDVMNEHSGLGFDERALYGATVSAYRFRDLEKSKKYLAMLVKKFPNTSFAKDATSEVKK